MERWQTFNKLIRKSINMESEVFIPYKPATYSEEEMKQRAQEFYQWLDSRRSVRRFSDEPIPIEIINNIIRAASTAPSGAHKQPWNFCVISDPEVKKKIREAAEKEEYENYTRRMNEEWLGDLKPFKTNHIKPYLEHAPYLIVVMKKAFEMENGEKKQTYYTNESVGIACGLLLAAIHHAGLVALTHTPSPMIFLKRILNRPKEEQPFLLIPVGKPAKNTEVPDIKRKPLEGVTSYY